MANQRSFDELCQRLKEAGGEAAPGQTGTMQITLRLPDASAAEGNFAKGAPGAVLFSFAMSTPWAQAATPASIKLMSLKDWSTVECMEKLSGDLDKASLLVVAKEHDDLTPLLPAATHRPISPAAASTRPTAPLSEDAAASGDASPGTSEQQQQIVNAASVMSSVSASEAQLAAAAAAAEPVLSSEGAKIQAVMGRAAASHPEAVGALQATVWNVDAAVQQIAKSKADAADVRRVAAQRRQEELRVEAERRRREAQNVSKFANHCCIGATLGGLSAMAAGAVLAMF